MEAQQPVVLLTRKPLRTSNDTIFPSLHPLGPLYSKKNLLQKRPSDMTNSDPFCFEPAKRLHIASQDRVYSTVRPSTESLNHNKKENGKENNPKSQQAENKSATAFEYGLSNIWEQILRVNIAEHQTNLVMQIMRQQMELTAQKVQQRASPERDQDLCLEVKRSEGKSSMGDSPFTLDGETEGETPYSKENQNEQEKSDQKVSLEADPLLQKQSNETGSQDCGNEGSSIEDTDNFEIPIVTIQAAEDSVTEIEENLMAGFEDKIKSPVVIDEMVQAVIPSFVSLRQDEATRKTPKLVWNPEEGKSELVDTLARKLSDLLGFEVTHEEKVYRLLRKYDFVVEKCLEVVGRQKNRYKVEFKSRRTSHRKYR